MVDPKSVLYRGCIDRNEPQNLCVVPDRHGRLPCAGHGEEVGLEEAVTRIHAFAEVIEHDKKNPS